MPTHTSMSDPKAVIQSIRQDDWLIDVDTDSRIASGIDNYRKNLSSALVQLSEDLYSKDTHFVLELIQNADDNEYAKGSTPSVQFRLDPGTLLLQNNEIGFQDHHVRALCKVGQSTKAKRLGYIGEKGIGFKSVFRISDCPMVVSNGYQFQFGKDDEQLLRFVVPAWVDSIPANCDPSKTNIVLALRDDVPNISDYFASLNAELLLFLQKLRRIAIEDANTQSTHVLGRRDLENSVELTSTIVDAEGLESTQVQHLLVHSRSVDRPGGLDEPKRVDVKHSEVILAFPVDKNGEVQKTTNQLVFAFLPVREYGFRFMIQADFLLQSNREDILKDRKWNIWLRDEIANTFADALSLFKSNEVLSRSYFHYLPLPDEIGDGFFGVVADQIFEVLRKSKSVPTESNNWCQPNEVVRGDAKLRSLISNEKLRNSTGKEYLAKDVLAPAKTLGKLGCERIAIGDVLKCLEDVEWLRKQAISWFRRLFLYFSALDIESDVIKEMAKLSLLRLANGDQVAAAKQPVFFPLDRNARLSFEKELSVLEPELFQCKYEEDEVKIREFLGTLGVAEPNPLEIIENMILPVYENDDWKGKPEPVLRGHVTYIKKNLREYINQVAIKRPDQEDELKRIRSSLRIRTRYSKDGVSYYDRPRDCYLPKSFGNPVDLSRIYKTSESNPLLSDIYINSTEKIKDKEERETKRNEWGTFFRKLGVNAGPRIYFSDGWDTAGETKNLPQTAEVHGYRFTDWMFTPFVCELIERNDPQVNETLLRAIDTHWRDYSGDRSKKTVTGQYYYERPSRTYPASFIQNLRQLNVPTKDGGTVKIENGYLYSAELRDMFGETLPYLKCKIRSAELLSLLGIPSKPTVETALKRLSQLVEEKSNDEGAFTRLYELLSLQFDQHQRQIQKAFDDQKLIYIEGKKPRYMVAEGCCWIDHAPLLEDRKGYLEKRYPGLRKFFLDQLEVPEDLRPKDLGNLLRELTKQKITESKQRQITRIYREFNRYLEQEDSKSYHAQGDLNWINGLVKEEVFWTNHQEFWLSEGNIFLDDMPEIMELFKDRTSVAFLNVPRSFIPHLRRFASKAGIQTLSSSVECSLSEHIEMTLDSSATSTIRSLLPHIARYLFAKSPSQYEKLFASNQTELLSNLEVWVAEHLGVTYQLNDEKAVASAPIFFDGTKLIIDERELSNNDVIAAELSRLLDKSGEITNLLTILLDRAGSLSGIESYFKWHRIEALPEEELQRIESQLFAQSEDAESRSGWKMDEDEREGEEEDSTEETKGEAAGAPVATETGPSETSLSASANPVNEGVLTGDESESGSRSGSALPPERGMVNSGTAEKEAVSTTNVPSGSTSKQIGTRNTGVPNRTAVSRPGGPGGQGTSRDSSSKVKRHRMVSYVAPREDHPSVGRDSFEDKAYVDQQVAAAGVKHAKAYEMRAGRVPEEQEHLNKGYDIISRSGGVIERYIEVKGIDGPWTEHGVGVSGAQFEFSYTENSDQSWLYVVEHALDDSNAKVYAIQSPARNVAKFAFPVEWNALAETVDESSVAATAGEMVRHNELGDGEIAQKRVTDKGTKYLVQFAKEKRWVSEETITKVS